MDHQNSGGLPDSSTLSAHSREIKPVTPGLQAWTPEKPEPQATTAMPLESGFQPPAASSSPSTNPMPSAVGTAAGFASNNNSFAGAASMPQPSAPPANQGFMGGSFAVSDEPSPSPAVQASTPYGTLTPLPSSGYSQSDQPTPVVKVLSVRGVEYLMMMFNLWIADSALLWIVLAVFNGEVGFSILAFPIAALLVTVPVFAYLFLRLKKAELLDPSLRFDPSKRRTTQLTQLFTFLVCLANIIGFIYVVINKIGGGSGMSIGKAFLNMLAVLIVVGGIFVYYWVDEHRAKS